MARKKKQPVEPTVEVPMTDDDKIKSDYVMKLVLEGSNYLDKFKNNWDDIIEKIRTIPPESWSAKEDWQSKVFIPMFAKGSEVAMSYMNKMLFGSKRWYSLWATKTELNKYCEPIMGLIDAILDRGRFTFAKNFALQEAIDIGTSFIKPLVRPDKRGMDFVWVSAYACFCDVDARHDFYKSRFWAPNYRYDLHQMIDDVKSGGNALWSRKGVQKLIEQGADEWEQLKKSAPTKAEENMSVVQSIDGTAQMTVTSEFTNVEVFEYWGLAPVKKTVYSETLKRDVSYNEYKLKKIIMGNRNTVLAEEDCPYRMIPAFPVRVKKRPYDLYGQGFFLNCTGLQDLANSMINLGFDSAKLASLDIIVMDKSKANDQESIIYRPTQIWDVKDPQNVRMTRPNNGMSALADTFRGVAFLNTVFQDTTGVTQQLEANTSLPGTPQGGADTLGIYQYQLQMADQRFLDQAKFVEDDFEHPLLHFVLDCILDPALISQEFINEILGFYEEKELDAQGQPTGLTKRVPVLDQEELIKTLNDLQKKDKSSDFDFAMIGLTQFIEKINQLKKLDGLIDRVMKQPAFAPYVNTDKTVERWFQLSEIPQWRELFNKNAPPVPPQPLVGPNGVVPQTGINPVAAPKENVIPPVNPTGGM
jgi:hypothetical protein